MANQYRVTVDELIQTLSAWDGLITGRKKIHLIACGGTALTHSDTFTGDTGATAYTISDVVRALKLYGLLTA